MNFSYYDFGYLEKGKIVEVQLSAAANVRLMDSTNYSNYKNGRKHRYYGGYVTRSPYRITVPSAGHWYLTIDLGGYSGTVRHNARVLSGMLPIAREQLPLVQEKNLYIDTIDANKEYDVFISHASEDKDSVDWEVKASLQQGITLPNGLIAINLPYMGSEGALPERVSENVMRDSNGNEVGYARYYVYPDSKQKLYDWIEDAYAARTTRSNLIKNPNEMMHYNAKCRHHGVTH